MSPRPVDVKKLQPDPRFCEAMINAGAALMRAEEGGSQLPKSDDSTRSSKRDKGCKQPKKSGLREAPTEPDCYFRGGTLRITGKRNQPITSKDEPVEEKPCCYFFI